MALGSDDYFITDNLNKFIDEWLNNNYGMVYFNLETNDGSIIETNEKNRDIKVGSMKAYKMSLVDTTRYVAGARAHEDCDFDYIVRNKPHQAAYSNLIVKHYNYPREGSLTDLEVNKQLMKTKEQGKKEGNSLDLIIPCHNLEEWIEPCLKSICSQENKLEAQRKAIFICDIGGGTVWRAMLSSRVIGNLRFNNRQNGEDNDFSWNIWNKPGSKYGKIDFAPYFYNFPRVGSQTWKKNYK